MKKIITIHTKLRYNFTNYFLNLYYSYEFKNYNK